MCSQAREDPLSVYRLIFYLGSFNIGSIADMQSSICFFTREMTLKRAERRETRRVYQSTRDENLRQFGCAG